MKATERPGSPGEASKSGPPPGPYDERGPIRVSFGVYLISVLLVGLIVFVIMLVQYLPGYRTSRRIQDAVKGADYVYVGIRIPKKELKGREINPLTKEDDLIKIIKDMGAGKVNAEINPDRTKIPYE